MYLSFNTKSLDRSLLCILWAFCYDHNVLAHILDH